MRTGTAEDVRGHQPSTHRPFAEPDLLTPPRPGPAFRSFPGLKIEGGTYTPPVQVQYGIRAVRAAQVGAASFFFFGEQLFGLLRRPAPALHAQMHENRMVTFGAIYGLDVRLDPPPAPPQHLVRPHTPHVSRFPRPPTAASLSAWRSP